MYCIARTPSKIPPNWSLQVSRLFQYHDSLAPATRAVSSTVGLQRVCILGGAPPLSPKTIEYTCYRSNSFRIWMIIFAISPRVVLESKAGSLFSCGWSILQSATSVFLVLPNIYPGCLTTHTRTQFANTIYTVHAKSLILSQVVSLRDGKAISWWEPEKTNFFPKIKASRSISLFGRHL